MFTTLRRSINPHSLRPLTQLPSSTLPTFPTSTPSLMGPLPHPLPLRQFSLMTPNTSHPSILTPRFQCGNLVKNTSRQMSTKTVAIDLPDLGEGTKEATIKEWYVQPGSKVNEVSLEYS